MMFPSVPPLSCHLGFAKSAGSASQFPFHLPTNQLLSAPPPLPPDPKKLTSFAGLHTKGTGVNWRNAQVSSSDLPHLAQTCTNILF